MYNADNTKPPYLLAATHKKRDKIVETPTTATATKNDNPAKMNCEDILWNTVCIYILPMTPIMLLGSSKLDL